MKKFLLIFLLASTLLAQKWSDYPRVTILDTNDVMLMSRSLSMKGFQYKNLLTSIFNNKKYTFPSSFKNGGVLYDSLGNGLLKWKQLAILGVDTSFNYHWIGLHTYDQDSIKIGGLWYDFPSTRIANSFLYDSLGNGILKWKTSIDSNKIGYLAKNQIWTGINRFNNSQSYFNTLPYTYPSTGRIAGTVLYDSLGDGVYKFRKMQPYILTTYPMDRNLDSVVMRYNTTNLKLTSNRLNTIQDIATTSSPTFGGLTAVNGNSNTQSIYPLLTDTYDLGSWTKYWSNAYISQLQATIFAENTISAVGGYMFITKGQGLLPVVGTATTQIDFGQTMTLNDFVLIKAKDTGGAYKTEYMQVGSNVSGTTYNVTRDVASAHVTDPAWADGTVYVILGNNGNGRLELNAYDTPRLSVIKQGAAYNSQTEYIRLGDLNGFLGYSSETYGIAIGEATKYLKYDPTNGLVIAGNITATTGAIGGWTLGATTLTGTNALMSSSGYVSFGATPPTSYGNNVGAWLGYTGGATAKSQLSLYSDASNYMQWNGSALSVGGATITGGILQTAISGARAEMSAANGFRLYASDGSYTSLTQDVSTGLVASGALTTGGNIGSGGSLTATTNITTTTGYLMGLNYYIVANGSLGSSYKFVDNNVNGSFNSLGISTTFFINSFGQLTKVNNIAATAKYTLIGDGTSFTPRLLAMSDLPALTANKVLLSDASGYVSASSISNTTLGYLDATSSIQTQLNARVTAVSGTSPIVSSGGTTPAISLDKTTANDWTGENSFTKLKFGAEVSHSVTASGNYDCLNKNVILLTPNANGYTVSLTNLSSNRPVLVLNASSSYSVTVNSTSGGKLLAAYGMTWMVYNATTTFTYIQ